MRTQRRVAQVLAAISLISLALGFSVLGLLIVANEHDGGASMTGGIISILLGAAFPDNSISALEALRSNSGRISGKRKFQQPRPFLKCDKLPMQSSSF
jgi:hypothetical protein